jgi:ELWxxDGT repeat protein
VADLFPGPFAGIVGSQPTLFPSTASVLFGENFFDAGIELAFTDGVQSGLLVNIGDEGLSDGSAPTGFLRLGDRVVFQAFEEATGAELWISDGTPGGTQLLADIDPTDTSAPGTQGSLPHHFVAFGDRAYFFAFHPDFGNELWSTDGTAAGTGLVLDLVPGPAAAEPLFSTPPVALDDALYFIAREPDSDFGLFRTDGTAAGTTLVVTTDPSGFVAEFTQLERVNDRLLFLATSSLGLELWTSDGTRAGPRPSPT